MNRLSSLPLAALVVSLAAAVGSARADYLNWSYGTSTVPPGFSATGAGGGGGSVQLTPFANGAGGTSIPILAFVTSAGTPVTFNAATSTYTLTMTITDKATNDSGSLTFHGAIGGSLSPTSASLTNTFTDTQQSLTLDGHVYTVTLPPSLSLADPTKPQQSLTATVSVTNGPISGVPEPASLVLGGLGFSLLGVGGWWKRGRRPIMQTA
ncbi:MAG TPA: hypothetical protein VN688_01630 [Gemmataceae bacterium]|nr:hypothetical protein [Gemmataceae bacterium]